MMTLPPPEQNHDPQAALIETLLESVDRLSRHRLGALLIVEHQTPITDQDVLRPGIVVDLPLNVNNLFRIFQPTSLLHDGAVQIRDQAIVAAGTLLPLSRQSLPRRYGTRHLAALGISEQVDSCLGVVVSEETGGITLTHRGCCRHNLTSPELQTHLRYFLT